MPLSGNENKPFSRKEKAGIAEIFDPLWKVLKTFALFLKALPPCNYES
jgi:hypothetical protein